AGTGAGGGARGRPRRPFPRSRTHPVAVPHRLLRANDLRLAQFRELARGWIADRRRRSATHRRRAARGAGSLRRTTQGRGRRADRLLKADPPLRERMTVHVAVAGMFFAFGVGIGLWGGASG